jgi:hypothetical protein
MRGRKAFSATAGATSSDENVSAGCRPGGSRDPSSDQPTDRGADPSPSRY